MLINREWLKEKDACEGGRLWFYEKYGKDAEIESLIVLDALIADDRLSDANWFVVRIMERPQYLAYAIYSAEQVLHIYEEKYPEDKRPRNAIEAAKKVLKYDTKENRADAAAAAAAAWRAAVDAAAAAAAWSAAAALRAADAAAWSAAAAWRAADAAADARKELQLKILSYGRGLLNAE